jgi:hypothetical protein
MEPEDLLPYSQEPSTVPYPDLDEGSPQAKIIFLQDPF